MTSTTPAEASHGSIKETVISLLIAFVLAFVFRGFVIEPFLIPTGSMAPTLLGAHERITNPSSGHTWTMGPWYLSPGTQQPLPMQGGRVGQTDLGPFRGVDPLTNEPLVFDRGVPSIAGDRIFVLKYMPGVFGPQRYDVAVFRDPQDPRQNFIKRMIGMPNEQVAIVDGDVFARPTQGGAAVAGNPFELDGWAVQRKPEAVQRAVWQPIFDSAKSPLPAVAARRNSRFTSPWVGGRVGDPDPAWKIEGRRSYRYEGQGATTLVWDTSADQGLDYDRLVDDWAYLREETKNMPFRWHLNDQNAYNEIFPQFPMSGGPMPQITFFPVSDLRLSAGVEPDGDSVTAEVVLRTRGHEFRARLSGTTATVDLRPLAGPAGAWTTLGSGPIAGFRKGRVTNIDFWHVDQALWLFVDEKPVVVQAGYDWTVRQRLEHCSGRSLSEIMTWDAQLRASARSHAFCRGSLYGKPELRWVFTGGPFTLHRVAVARDLYYQPAQPSQGAQQPVRAGHPSTLPTLNGSQYFMCGDNSPSSSDGRAWSQVDPWVAHSVDASVGVVHHDLLVGKAFFVYFPAAKWTEPIAGVSLPVPDVGRVRWIW